MNIEEIVIEIEVDDLEVDPFESVPSISNLLDLAPNIFFCSKHGETEHKLVPDGDCFCIKCMEEKSKEWFGDLEGI